MKSIDLGLVRQPLCACGRAATPGKDLCRKCYGRARWLRRQAIRNRHRDRSREIARRCRNLHDR